jgi:isopenicillin N synthase-like dioxygenase
MSPSHNHTSLDIPVIDIRATNPAAPQQLLDAARRFGFVYVANNEAGVDPDLIAQTFDISQNFFALPVEDKRKVSIGSNAAGKNVGWL